MKETFKNKKVIIGVIVALFILGCIGGYFIYENNRKNDIKDKMKIIFTDVKEVEYGTKNFDVKKELVKEVKNAELTDVPEIDTTKIGEVNLKFTLTKNDVTKKIDHKIKVVDTNGPEIALEADSKEIIVGDEYDLMSNIKEVKDEVDGAIEFYKDALETNKKATDEYNKLGKDNIKKDTKIVENSVNDFLIEDVKDNNGKVLYLKNCYYVEGSVDIANIGEYEIKVVAVDKNGIKATKQFTVTVKEKEVEKPVSSNGSGSSSSSSGGGNTSNGGGSVQRGSKQDIVNLALAQIGKTYAINTQGPNSFDCSGLIWYAYTQNGWSIPRNVSSGGTTISFDQLQPGDIIDLPNKNHVMLYIGNNQVVEARNPNEGIKTRSLFMSNLDSAIFIRY